MSSYGSLPNPGILLGTELARLTQEWLKYENVDKIDLVFLKETVDKKLGYIVPST